MREIKFRGKTSAGSSWVYGHYWEDKDLNVHLINNGKGINFEVDPETVGQFIGLPDKNSKEIYEGDVFKSYDALHTVIWLDDLCAYGFASIMDKNQTTLLPELFDIEVIGNIHENKDLLEGK